MFARYLLLLTLLTSPALAASPVNTPVYDQSSKSYFALIDGTNHNTKFHGSLWVWEEALTDAPTKLYKGVHGRLAIISSVETYEFLMKTFQVPADTWIGYKYLCKAKRLIDSTGRDVTNNQFAAWDQKWNQDPGIACAVNQFTHDYEPNAYAPVAIGSMREGFRWFVKGPAKGYTYYFIEWPTGGE